MKQLLKNIRIAQVLKSAREIVEKRWVKGAFARTGDGAARGGDSADGFLGIPDFGDDDWGYCGDGALRRAIKNELKLWQDHDGPIQKWKIEKILHETHKALVPPIQRRRAVLADGGFLEIRPQNAIWCFNDLPDTRKEDILAVFDEAIEAQCAKVKELGDAAGIQEASQGSGVEEGERPL